MRTHGNALAVAATGLVAVLAGGCVRIAEIALVIDAREFATFPGSTEAVNALLRSVDHGLVDAANVQWQDVDDRAVTARVCRAGSETHCVFTMIERESSRVRIAVRVQNPKGCFREADYEWARRVSTQIVKLTGNRARTVRDSGVCGA